MSLSPSFSGFDPPAVVYELPFAFLFEPPSLPDFTIATCAVRDEFGDPLPGEACELAGLTID